jgi:signal peptidase I
MSRMLEFLAVIVRKIETVLLYFIERFYANFQEFGQGMKTMVVLFILVSFLFACYVVVLILRLDFKRRLRRLRNVRTMFYLDLLREKDKLVTFVHEILFFQKVVIIDEKVVLRVPFEVDVKQPKMKRLKTLKPKRKKDLVKEQSIPLLDPADDVYVLDFLKLNRRMVVSTLFIVLTILTLILSKYHDFDVIFRGIYMLKYDDYNMIDNFGSWLFILGYFISIAMTLFIWIYFYTRGKWQDKLNMRRIYDTFDIVSIIPTFIAVLTILNAFLISPATVTRTSMEPTYFEGDNIFITHVAKYDRFDVVIVLATESEYNPSTDSYTMNEFYIKRIIGLPGDTITIQNGFVYVNGNEIDDSVYLKPNTMTYCETGIDPDVDETCTFTIPEGEYFLLGDNRTASYDSRQIGTFKEEKLYGVVLFKVG